MKYLITISLVLCAFLAKAQHASSPAIKQPYWVDYGFVQNDSGYIPAHRDTLWTPRKTGTQVYWEHAGVDTATWNWSGSKWDKLAGDSRWLKSGNDIYNNNSGNVVVGTASGSFTEKLQSYGDLRIRADVNKNFVVNDAFGISYLSDAGFVTNATFTMGAVSFPFSNIGIKETATGSITNPSLGITRTVSIDTGATLVSIHRITSTIAPTGGSSAVNNIGIITTVNQTGGANGITRGLYINPTLTASADWRSIDNVRGRVYFGEDYVNSSNGDSALSTSTTGKVQNKIIHDHITAGTGIIVSGSGTTPDPYVITNSGGGGGGGSINTVVGTANRITVTGTTDLVINVSPSYAGDPTITTLGTIATGVWNGTAIADAYIASQATWNAKQAAITGGATTITTSNLTASRALVSDGSGKVGVSTATATDLTNLPLQYTSQALTDGATITFNCNSGYVGTVTLGGNRTLSITNPTAWHTVRVKFTQDGTGSRTITLPANSKVPLGFGSGTTINLSTTAGAIDWAFGDWDGSNWWWTIAKNYQ